MRDVTGDSALALALEKCRRESGLQDTSSASLHLLRRVILVQISLTRPNLQQFQAAEELTRLFPRILR